MGHQNIIDIKGDDMRYTKNVTIFIFFIWVNLYSQIKIDLNEGFNRMWLLKPYFEKLLNEKRVCEAYSFSDFEIHSIRINKATSTIILSTFNEGVTDSFTITNPNEIYIPKSLWFKHPYSLSLIEKSKENVLAFYEFRELNKDTVYFKSLSNEYNNKNGFTNFINDKYFTGTYISEDAKYRLVFHQDGTLEGFLNYNRFIVDVFLPRAVQIDVVTFQNDSKNNIRKGSFEKMLNDISFHWEKVGNDIWLYNLSDLTPEAEVTSLFTKLKKVD